MLGHQSTRPPMGLVDFMWQYKGRAPKISCVYTFVGQEHIDLLNYFQWLSENVKVFYICWMSRLDLTPKVGRGLQRIHFAISIVFDAQRMFMVCRNQSKSPRFGVAWATTCSDKDRIWHLLKVTIGFEAQSVFEVCNESISVDSVWSCMAAFWHSVTP